MQQGIRLLRQGDAACAQTWFQAAVQADPSSAPAWAGLGESAQALEQTLRAEESYRRAYALDAGNLPAITHLAALLEQEKQTNAAVGFWKIAARLAPDDPAVRFSLATALLANGSNAEAAPVLRSLLTRDIEERGAVLLDLGTALARLGQYDEAAGAFQQALAFPDVSDTARLALVKALCSLLRYPQARPYAQQYLASHPTEYEALYLMGLIDSGLGDSRAAEQELRAAVLSDPKQFDAQLQLGEALRHNGDAAAAVAPLQAAARLKPDSRDVHFQLARAYSATGQTALAGQEYLLLKHQEAENAARMQVTVLDNEAAAAVGRHDDDAAALAYQKIEELEPDDGKVLYDLGMLYLRRNEVAKGLAFLRQAQARSPDMADANAELGYLDMVDGRDAQAEAELKAALKADPQSARALGNLGVLYAKQHKLPSAVRCLQLAVESDPKYAQGHLNLGLVLANLQRLPEAESELEEALALAPQDANATEALRMVREQMSPAGR